ncbi:MAG: ribbon-helix-helix domain-containing protein [Actinomycetota bacterium]|nr:ribbon-helix-helix domain-containing protein [Actinomycetota bacterium]
MTMEQIAVRIPVELLAQLDRLVERGTYSSRAAAVRAGVEAVTEAERRRAIDQSYIDGYTKYPPTAQEDAEALALTIEAIAEEPW